MSLSNCRLARYHIMHMLWTEQSLLWTRKEIPKSDDDRPRGLLTLCKEIFPDLSTFMQTYQAFDYVCLFQWPSFIGTQITQGKLHLTACTLVCYSTEDGIRGLWRPRHVLFCCGILCEDVLHVFLLGSICLMMQNCVTLFYCAFV